MARQKRQHIVLSIGRHQAIMAMVAGATSLAQRAAAAAKEYHELRLMGAAVMVSADLEMKQAGLDARGQYLQDINAEKGTVTWRRVEPEVASVAQEA